MQQDDGFEPHGIADYRGIWDALFDVFRPFVLCTQPTTYLVFQAKGRTFDLSDTRARLPFSEASIWYLYQHGSEAHCLQANETDDPIV
jgi:hypothetical protein